MYWDSGTSIKLHITFKEPILMKQECFSWGTGNLFSVHKEDEEQSPQEQPSEGSPQE